MIVLSFLVWARTAMWLLAPFFLLLRDILAPVLFMIISRWASFLGRFAHLRTCPCSGDWGDIAPFFLDTSDLSEELEGKWKRGGYPARGCANGASIRPYDLGAGFLSSCLLGLSLGLFLGSFALGSIFCPVPLCVGVEKRKAP